MYVLRRALVARHSQAATDTTTETTMPMAPRLTLKQIAPRIDAHLRRFESDPAINKYPPSHPDHAKGKPYWQACANAGRTRVYVRYISYQGPASLTLDEATRYLAKLDAGYVGRHYQALREK